MRLSKEQEIRATNELLALLRDDWAWGRGCGLRTSEMRGTSSFHGQNALSLRQIARLLRRTGRVVSKPGGSERYSYNVWYLTEWGSSSPDSLYGSRDRCG